MLKREMELAMFDALVEQCQARGIRKIVGIYIPSKKNGMVAEHYASLGFSSMGATSEGRELWSFDVPATYSPRTRHIRRIAEALSVTSKRGQRICGDRGLIVNMCGQSAMMSRETGLNPLLDPVWQVEVDRATPAEWSAMLDLFNDANIYQTWSYGAVRWGRKNLSHLVLKRNGEVVGMAQLRIVRPTRFNFGMAYLRWGPLCQRRGRELDAEVVLCMARALEEEYVGKRGLLLQILPNAFVGIAARRAISIRFSRFTQEPQTVSQYVPDFRSGSRSSARGIAQESRQEMAKPAHPIRKERIEGGCGKRDR